MTQIEIGSAEALGKAIRARRRELGLRQADLSFAANVGIRFIVDAEKGKETCHVGLIFRILKELGMELNMSWHEVLSSETSTDQDFSNFDPDAMDFKP